MNHTHKWLKYDLHMHSHYSKITKSGDKDKVVEMSANEFVSKLIGNVDVFSITDHNYYSNDYYSKIRENISDKNIAIIDGVELDVYIDDNNFFQMLVYFSQNEKGDVIEKAICDLYLNNNKPKLSTIISQLLELDIKFMLLPEGNKDRGIVKILNKIDSSIYEEITKYAMYKIFSGYDVKKNFNEKSQNVWAENYFKSTQKFKESISNLDDDEIKLLVEEINKKISDGRINISEKAENIYQYIIQYSNYFAYFSFSDWHNKTEYKPKVNNFIFGSLDTAFESFEMAVLDPTSRIIKSDESEIIIPESIIKQVQFDINDNNYEIKFLPGLNAIIGARGSGKSLLIAIIKRLFNSKDSTLDAYKDYHNVINIKAVNYGGITIKEGGLTSIAILEQSQIEKIYIDPENAWKSISAKFPSIAELNMESINKINDYLSKISQIDSNFKSVTTNIKQIKKSRNYVYKSKEEFKVDVLQTNIREARKNLNKILDSLKSIGFNVDGYSKQINTVISNAEYYETKIIKYNEIISNYNTQIKEMNSSKTSLERTNQINRMEIETALNIFKSNFQKILNFKKIEHLMDKFKFDVVPTEVKPEKKYMFVTSYKIPDNLKETILEKLAGSLRQDKNKTEMERLKSYVLGETQLLKNKKINEDLEKFLNTEFFESEKDFYQIIDSKYDFSKLTSNKAVEEAEKNNVIKNLTNSSLGTKSAAYLDMLFDTDETILLFDQPEDNIDNEYISKFLVPLIKTKKHQKQLIFVTHNPSVAVYGDAFNYIYATNEEGLISYENFFIESRKDRENIIKILEGGKPSFSNRNQKYGNILGEEEYEVDN
jgi:ABC-type lipoprotein export system ATPase subunit